jgi:hypothetical protein
LLVRTRRSGMLGLSMLVMGCLRMMFAKGYGALTDHPSSPMWPVPRLLDYMGERTPVVYCASELFYVAICKSLC